LEKKQEKTNKHRDCQGEGQMKNLPLRTHMLIERLVVKTDFNKGKKRHSHQYVLGRELRQSFFDSCLKTAKLLITFQVRWAESQRREKKNFTTTTGRLTL